MSDGVPVPVPWPPAINTGSTYPVIIVDEGTYLYQDIVDGTTTEASLVVRVEGLPDTVDAISLAEDAAMTAYPTHPSGGCLTLWTVGPIFGHQHLKGNSMVVGRGMTTDTDATLGTGSTGTVVLVKLLYRMANFIVVESSPTVIRIVQGGGSGVITAPGGQSVSASFDVVVRGVASRADAIAAAEALYPTYPDDPTIPLIGASASFLGLVDCTSNNQSWRVTLRYGRLNEKLGRTGQGYHGLNYTSNDRKVFYQSFRDENTTIDAVIAARASGTGPNGEPFEGYDVHVERTLPSGDVVDSTIRYAWPALQVQVNTLVRTVNMPKHVIPMITIKQALSIPTNTPTSINIGKVDSLKLESVNLVGRELKVYWRSNSSVVAAFASVDGYQNIASYTIAGVTIPQYCGVCTGVDEVDYGSTFSPRYQSTITFVIAPFGDAWKTISIDKNLSDSAVDPDNPWEYTVTDPYSDMQTAFPSPPPYVP